MIEILLLHKLVRRGFKLQESISHFKCHSAILDHVNSLTHSDLICCRLLAGETETLPGTSGVCMAPETPNPLVSLHISISEICSASRVILLTSGIIGFWINVISKNRQKFKMEFPPIYDLSAV